MKQVFLCMCIIGNLLWLLAMITMWATEYPASIWVWLSAGSFALRSAWDCIRDLVDHAPGSQP